MTQQALIARLRKMEGALAAANAVLDPCAPYDSRALDLTGPALVDLRELIREAEGQQTARNITCEKCVANECTCCTDCIGGELYTALGEKP